MSYILALDQGTSSCRAIVFDEKANIISKAQKSIAQIFLKPGWVEQDPIEILKTQIEVTNKALKEKNINPNAIKAIGIANQRETTVIWDKATGLPICNAIVWQDRRTDEICKSHKPSESMVQKKTGLLVDPYFSATKIQWILENVDQARQKAEKNMILFGTIDTWLIWNLTDKKHHVTDTSNASRTLLFNIQTLSWDDDLLKLFNIPTSILPKVCLSSEKIGYVDKKFFQSEIPICGVIGDQQAALFGQACTEYGQIKCTYGSGSFLLMNTGKKPIETKKHLITTVGWSLPEFTHYALEGSIFNAGTVLNWIKDELNFIHDVKELEEILNSVESTEGIYFVSALTGLGAPHWNPNAKGLIYGLTIQTKKAHLLRAAIESIAYQVDDLINAFEVVSNKKISEVTVDGGLTKSNYLMQFQADISQKKITQFSINEITALGAALMAGIAIKLWHFSQIKEILKRKATYLAKMGPKEVAKMRKGWKKAVRIVNEWDFYE